MPGINSQFLSTTWHKCPYLRLSVQWCTQHPRSLVPDENGTQTSRVRSRMPNLAMIGNVGGHSGPIVQIPVNRAVFQ